MLNWIAQNNQPNPQTQPSTWCGLNKELGDKSLSYQSIKIGIFSLWKKWTFLPLRGLPHNQTTLDYFPLENSQGLILSWDWDNQNQAHLGVFVKHRLYEIRKAIIFRNKPNQTAKVELLQRKEKRKEERWKKRGKKEKEKEREGKRKSRKERERETRHNIPKRKGLCFVLFLFWCLSAKIILTPAVSCQSRCWKSNSVKLKSSGFVFSDAKSWCHL